MNGVTHLGQNNPHRPKSVGAARFWLIGLVFAVASVAWAHLETVKLNVSVRGQDLVLRASSEDGYPIQGARFAYRLVAPDGKTFQEPLREGANGAYSAPRPDAPSGPYTLSVRDTTLPDESTEVSTDVRWPLAGEVALELQPEEEETRTTRPAVVPVLVGGLGLLALGAFAWRRKGRSRTA